jgi:sodium transport system ATP-binding protein
VDPDSGTVSVEGLDPVRHRREYQRRLAFLPAASVGLYARLTVTQHLEYWAGLSMIPFPLRKPWMATVTRQFNLDELAGQRVDRLSMGQRQRVRLAMTFLPRPALALLDEPRNSLDATGTEMLADAIAEATADGRTAIWCSPTGEETRLDVDRRYLITEGRLESVEPAAVT